MTTISSICYHYIARDDEFNDIRGHTFELFKEHIGWLQSNYDIIDPKDVLAEKFEDGKKYMILTFDDGLREHVRIARYLDEVGVKGFFAIPTCILRGEPANPQVIHFGLAYYGVEKFYSFLKNEMNNDFSEHVNLLPAGQDRTVKNLKDLFKSELGYKASRKILLNIFNDHIKKDFPDFMERVYLSKDNIVDLAKNGHTIAVHTDTHPVVKDIASDEEAMKKEVVQAKQDLEDLIGEEIGTFAYPFGAVSEILDDISYLVDNKYKLALTTFKNKENLDLLDLGRYCTFSQDSVDDLSNNLWHYKIRG